MLTGQVLQLKACLQENNYKQTAYAVTMTVVNLLVFVVEGALSVINITTNVPRLHSRRHLLPDHYTGPPV